MSLLAEASEIAGKSCFPEEMEAEGRDRCALEMYHLGSLWVFSPRPLRSRLLNAQSPLLLPLHDVRAHDGDPATPLEIPAVAPGTDGENLATDRLLLPV